ncbi:MAG TPA: ABC transporter substrate-binding protein [Candidatus Acidoferrales bacterium]|nr:ABC transporter substrate-binding protein [Candidatus Acidoferrales bacterium]
MASYVAAAVLLAVVGCDRAGRPPGTIQVDFETSPPSTDPRLATDAASSRLNELIFDSLMKIDRNGEFVGDLAERIERPTPTEIIFHLRRGVRFSDGRELTARDVKFTYDSIENPDLRSPKRASLQELKAIESPDDYTVVMTTAKPYAPALEMAAQGVVPYGTAPPLRNAAAAPTGSGPFMMSSFARDEMIRLERNPFHESAPAAPAAILVKIVPDATVRALELAEGVCDFSGNNLEPDVLPWLGAHRFLTISNTAGTTYKYLSFNFRDPRLRDIRVRRAIAYAIDRATIVKSMLRGSARVATGLLAPESWAYDGDVTTYPYDPERSRRLLDEAGYPAGPNGMRALQIEFKTTPEGSRLAEVFQAMLRRVGIALNVRTLEFATYYADIQAGNFDMTSLQWVGINDPNHYYMVFDSTQTPPGMNRGFYSNPELDRLLEAGRRTIDADQRRKIYAQVQRLVADDLPYVSLWWVDNVAVMNRRLADFQPYPNGSLRSLATLTLIEPGAAEPSR